VLHTPSSIGVRVLCVSFLFAWAAPAVAQSQPSVANAFSSASWLLSYNWENAGSGQTIITFNSDGTFATADGGHGRWFQRNGDPRAVFTYAGVSGVPDWSVTYALTVAADGGSFSGIQGWSHTSGRPQIGTHTAVRTRFSEKPEALAPMLMMTESPVDSSGARHSAGSGQHKEK
jgi:hypothetical protein